MEVFLVALMLVASVLSCGGFFLALADADDETPIISKRRTAVMFYSICMICSFYYIMSTMWGIGREYGVKGYLRNEIKVDYQYTLNSDYEIIATDTLIIY